MMRLKLCIALASIGMLVITSHTEAQNLKLLVFQNAMAGDAVSIIDPTMNKVVGQIPNIEISNGLAASPDGSRLYVTGEVAQSLFVVDTKTMTVTTKVPTTGRPSGVTLSRDGRRIYIGIQDHGGSGMDIIDATTLKLVKNLPLEGEKTHYVYLTPDGKYVAATSNGGKTPEEALTIRLVDTKTEEYVRKIVGVGTGGHRACDYYPNPDGSTKWMMCNQGEQDGFVVYDFNTGKIVQRVQVPAVMKTVHIQNASSSQGSPSHGMAVSPDHKILAVSDRWYNLVHIYSLPDLKHLYAIPMGVDPFWFAFTPDGKFIYVSDSESESVSVLDVQQRREVSTIHVQAMPKRIIAAMVYDPFAPARNQGQ